MVKIHLKEKNASKSVLLLVFHSDGQRVKITSGISVVPSKWKPKREEVAETQDYPEAETINAELRRIKRLIQDAQDYFRMQSIHPTAEQWRDKYLELLNGPKKANSTPHFWDYYEQFLESKEAKISATTFKQYDSALRNHLKEAERHFGVKLSLNIFKERAGFARKFDRYLFSEPLNADGEKGLSINTVGKLMKGVKTFLGWCFRNELCDTFDITHIIKYQMDTDNVFLEKDEIEKLIRLELDDKDDIKARDLFVFGCEVGLRWSDLSRLKPGHFNNGDVHIHQKKTEGKVKIPLSSKARAIATKYDYQLPNYKNHELTVFNSRIQELCRKAGIDQEIVLMDWSRGESKEIFKKKYELISSHTCRRSFCTNRFKDGIPTHVIMAISGHKTEKSFLKYLKLGKNDLIDIYRERLAN